MTFIRRPWGLVDVTSRSCESVVMRIELNLGMDFYERTVRDLMLAGF